MKGGNLCHCEQECLEMWSVIEVRNVVVMRSWVLVRSVVVSVMWSGVVM